MTGSFSEDQQGHQKQFRGDPDQLSLGGITRLVVESPEDISRRAGVIVLNKIGINAEAPKCFAIPRLEEEAPGITEYLRLQQKCIVDFSGVLLHGCPVK